MLLSPKSSECYGSLAFPAGFSQVDSFGLI